jgi:hypothetical protein
VVLIIYSAAPLKRYEGEKGQQEDGKLPSIYGYHDKNTHTTAKATGEE